MTQTSDSAGWADVDREAALFTRMLAARTNQFEAVRELLLAMLGVQPGDRILDVGCGIGDHARALAERVGPAGRVVGVDRGEAMIAQARERSQGSGLPVEFQVGDAAALEFRDASFDRVRSSLLLLHVEDPAAVVAEMVRVVRPGGTVLLSENDLGTAAINGPDRELTRLIQNHLCDRIRHGWIGRSLVGLCIDAGLEDVVVNPFTIVIRDLDFWERANGPVQRILDSAVDAGVLSRGQADGWLEGLRRLDREGKFFASVTAFAATGRKPS